MANYKAMVRSADQLLNVFKKHDDIVKHASDRMVQKMTHDNYGLHAQSVMDARCEHFDGKPKKVLSEGKKVKV